MSMINQTTERVMKWYTVKVQNNHEKKVSERVKLDMSRDYNEEVNVVVPVQNTLQIKEGKRVTKEQLLYPGYIFVETKSPGTLELVVKATNGATNILKDKKNNAIPLRQSEVDKMMGQKETPGVVLKNSFFQGERVMVTEGAFSNFKGVIETIDVEKDKVKVEVMIFGRKTYVDLTLADIIKSDE
jgi:transcription termination/antitermination protein NusG